MLNNGDKNMCKKVGTPVKEYLLSLGFTSEDIAVENMDVEEIQRHIHYLNSKKFPKLSIKENINAIHRIANLWGIEIPPGYIMQTPESNTQRVYYCEYTYANRKRYAVKLVGGSPCCFGTAIISLL